MAGSRKRKRGTRASETPGTSRPASPSFTPRGQSAGLSETNASAAPDEIVMTEEDFDIQHHKQITAKRNFDKVVFGDWLVKTW